MTQKKAGLFSAVCMGVGTIIGAGIFGALPAAVGLVGMGIFWAFAIATISTIIRSLPGLAPGCAIPSPAGYYMHLSRLLNPYVGFLDFILIIMEIFIITLLATVFGQYFAALVPVDQTVAAAGILVFFGITACFDFSIGSKVQTVMTVTLVGAILIFVGAGAINLNPELISFKEVVLPSSFNIVTMGAAVGLLTGCLQGGVCIMQFADAYKNPRKVIMQSFLLATVAAMVIYMLMSFAVVGTTSLAEISTLDSLIPVASRLLSPALLTVFIVGGALLGSSTSINGVLMSSVYRLNTIGKDKVMPDFVTRENRFGAQPVAIWLVIAAALFIVIFKLPIGVLLSVSSVITTVVTLLELLPVLVLKKRYPYCYKNAAVKFPEPALWTMIIIAFGLGLWQVYSMITTTMGIVWIATAITVVVCYGYFLLRKVYLKKKGVDLIALMRIPYPEWEENEKRFAEEEKAKKS